MPEKQRKANRYVAVFLLVIGLFLACAELMTWKESRNSTWVAPIFDDLTVSQGKISFTDHWKSFGGFVALQLENGSSILLSCSIPDGSGGEDCSKIKDGGHAWKDYRQQLKNKNAIAWWRPEIDATNRRLAGRVYQIKVDGWLFFEYSERVKYYKNRLHSNQGVKLLFASLYFLMLVLPSFILLLKGRK